LTGSRNGNPWKSWVPEGIDGLPLVNAEAWRYGAVEGPIFRALGLRFSSIEITSAWLGRSLVAVLVKSKA
jgi:hypothetical protein